MLRAIFCFAMLLGFTNAFADHPPRVTLKKNVGITIKEYKKDADVFVVVSQLEPEIGPNYATPEALKNAIGEKGTIDNFTSKIGREMGAIYVLKKNLPLLWLNEVEARKKKTNHK